MHWYIRVIHEVTQRQQQQLGGNETSNDGCNPSPKVHDFTHNSIII